jgi:cobalt-zinc-cadmium resistance protein CzcA
LEYISARNQARQVALSLSQARQDERIALQNLNRWLGVEATYMPTDVQLTLSPVLVDTHPALELSAAQVTLTERKVKADRAAYLPKFYLEAGSQKIGSKMGYWTYQVGVSVPLFSRARTALAHSGKIEKDAAMARQEQQRMELESSRRTLSSQHEKWKASLKYYQEVALPMAEEQQRSAVLSYQEGETDYIGFIQNMNDVVKVQLDYWNTYGEYLNSGLNLQYY